MKNKIIRNGFISWITANLLYVIYFGVYAFSYLQLNVIIPGFDMATYYIIFFGMWILLNQMDKKNE